MLIWLPIPLLAVTVTLLVRAQDRQPRDVRQIRIWKPLSTALVIAVCGLSLTRSPGASDEGYTLLLLGGLGLSLIGDVLLIRQTTRAFVGGLIAFLLAHVAYIAAISYLQALYHPGLDAPAEYGAAGALALAATGFYVYLSPSLGQMRLPVITYLIVVSVVVQRALALAAVHAGPPIQSVLIVLGALLFYLSDAILALNRFRFGGRMPHYPVWNLPTYYAGQLCLALSASFIT